MFKYGFQIPESTKIGRGFRIVHFGMIVIHPLTIIGENFNISQGVTIGNSQGKSSGTPIIGDNVCIQPNAVVVGGIKIGNNVLIAPNAFVNFDVPDNAIVIGNPGKIILKENPTAKFIVYPV
jgi:serine O-acetyltransferase